MTKSFLYAAAMGAGKVNAVFVSMQRGFLFLIMAVLSLSMFAEIITRYFFNTSLFGLEEFVGYTAVWLYFIGAAYGTYERSHIKAEFVDVLFRGPRVNAFIRALSAVLSTFISAVFTSWCWDFVVESIEINELSPTHDVPMVYFQSALLVGGALMTLYFALEAAHYTNLAISQKEGHTAWKV